MDMTKAGFTAGMIGNDLENTIPAGSAASDLSMMLAYNTTIAGDAAGGFNLLDYFYSQFNQYFAAMNLSEMNNATGMGEVLITPLQFKADSKWQANQ